MYACVFVCAPSHARLSTSPRSQICPLFAQLMLLTSLVSVSSVERKQWRPLKESLITVIAARVIRKSIRYFHLDNCSQTKRAGNKVSGAMKSVRLNPYESRFSRPASPPVKGPQWKFPLVEETTCRFKIWCQVPVSLCGRNASFVGESLV